MAQSAPLAGFFGQIHSGVCYQDWSEFLNFLFYFDIHDHFRTQNGTKGNHTEMNVLIILIIKKPNIMHILPTLFI